jgi:hypothetical protein
MKTQITIVEEWIGTDGHTYCRMSDGSIGHLDCWCLDN